MTRATRGIVLVFASLALAALLNAQGLRKTAQIQPQGWHRGVALAVTNRLADVSGFLRLDRPRHELQVAIGRGSVDRIDTQILLAVPKPVVRAAVHRRTPVRRTRPHPPAPRPVFTPRRPLRVWVAGDSLAQVPGDALERAAGSGGPVAVVGVESRLSTGLGRPDLYNWFTRIRDAISSLRPNVAVFSFGADDAHDYMSGVPAGHTIGKLGSSSWDAEYRRRAAGVTAELNDAGVYVVWLGLPLTRGPGYRRGFHAVNRVLERLVRADPNGAALVDTWHMLATRSGRYADYLRNSHGALVLMRAADGVHYTPAAGDLIACAVLDRLGRSYDLGSARGRRVACGS